MTLDIPCRGLRKPTSARQALPFSNQPVLEILRFREALVAGPHPTGGENTMSREEAGKMLGGEKWIR